MKKIKISAKAVNYMVGTCLVVFAVLIWMMTRVSTDVSRESSSYELLNELPAIDPIVPDSLPHYEYQKRKQDNAYLRKMKEGALSSWGSDAWFTGFTTRKSCDTCLNFAEFSESKGTKDYLIMLKWWELDTGTYYEPRVYYMKNAQSFVRKTTCVLISTDTAQQYSNYDCTQLDVPVPFRYDKKGKGIMIPVSKEVLDVFKPVFIVFFWGGTFICFYYLAVAFLQILVDIRNGNPFSVDNVKRLKLLTVFCFAAPIVLFLLNLLMWGIFYRYFTEDIKLSSAAWLIFWKPFVLGLIFAALYSAFKRGKQLKEEQDLTI